MGLNEFYLAIKNRVATITEVAFFDWWHEQPFDEEQDIPYGKPAVFFELPSPIKTNSLGRKLQDGDIVFNLYLQTEVFHQTDSLAPENITPLGLDYLIIADKIFAKFHGYNGHQEGVSFGTISRQDIEIIDLGPYMLVRQEFNCKGVFDAAQDAMEQIDKPDMTVTTTLPA